MGGGGSEHASNGTEEVVTACVHHLSEIRASVLEENGVHFSILLVVLIALTIAFELLDHLLTYKLRGYPHLLFAVGRIYKEIMILGLINMIVFVLGQTGALNFTIKEETFDELLFEFVHLALFLISIVYLILSLLFIIVLIQVAFRYWAKVDIYSSSEQAQTEVNFMESKVASSLLYRFNPIYRAKLVLARRQLYFDKIKENFIEGNGITDRNFKFARYLRKCSRKAAVELMEVNWKIWAFFLILAVLNCLRVLYLGELKKGTTEGYLTFGYGILLFNIFLEGYCHHALEVVSREEKSTTHKLILIHRHNFMSLVFQFTLFLHAIYTAMLIMIGAKEFYLHYDHSVGWFVIVIAFLPPFIAGFVFFPSSFPMYVIASHVGEHTDRKLLIDALKPPSSFSAELEAHQTLDHGVEINLAPMGPSRDRLMSFQVKKEGQASVDL